MLVAMLALLHLHIHLHHHFRGPAVDYVGLVAASAASWFGVAGLGEPVLIAAGVFAAKHKLDITSVVVAAWAGAAAGGVLGWLVGLKAGRAVLTGPGPLRRARLKAVARGEEVFTRHPVMAIMLTPSWIAGIHGVAAAVYLATNAATALLWAAAIGLGAYFLGPTVVEAVDDLGLITGIALALLVAAVVAAEIVRRRRRSSLQRLGSEL